MALFDNSIRAPKFATAVPDHSSIVNPTSISTNAPSLNFFRNSTPRIGMDRIVSCQAKASLSVPFSVRASCIDATTFSGLMAMDAEVSFSRQFTSTSKSTLRLPTVRTTASTLVVQLPIVFEKRFASKPLTRLIEKSVSLGNTPRLINILCIGVSGVLLILRV